MVEACDRRILEFPLDMDAREVAKELKREGWYAWASNYDRIVFRIQARAGKSGNLNERVCLNFPPLTCFWCMILAGPAEGWSE